MHERSSCSASWLTNRCPVSAIRRSPPTAVRLLEEFVQLEAGDTLVQNGATSNVGRVSVWAALPALHLAGVPTWRGWRYAAAELGGRPPRSPLLSWGVFPWEPVSAFQAHVCTPCMHLHALQYIIQLAKSKGINTVNIIRDRPDR